MAGVYAGMNAQYDLGLDAPGVTARGIAVPTNWAGLQVSVEATVLPIITRHFDLFKLMLEAKLLNDVKHAVVETVRLNVHSALKRTVMVWFDHNRVEDGRLIRANVLRVEVSLPNGPMTWRWDL